MLPDPQPLGAGMKTTSDAFDAAVTSASEAAAR